MTIEEIYRKHGIGVQFIYLKDTAYIYEIVGRWRYGILYTDNYSSRKRRLRFDTSIHDYSIYDKNEKLFVKNIYTHSGDIHY